MPEPLEREVTFDIAPALDALKDLDREFEQSARQLERELSDAVDGALGDVKIGDVDAAPVTEAITTAVAEGVATPAIVEGDATAVTGEVATAIVDGTAAPAVVEGDASDVSAEITNAIEGADTNLLITGDTNDLITAIDTAIASADGTVTVDADTSEAEAAISGLSDEAINIQVDTNAGEASGELEDLSGATEDATQSTQGLSTANTLLSGAVSTSVGNTKNLGEIVGLLGPQAKAAAVGVAALGGFIGIATAGAIKSEEATRRFNRALGDTAASVEDINIDGLDTNIKRLATDLGSSASATRSAVATNALLGQSAGATSRQIAQTSEQLIALAARAIALDPSLGTLDSAVKRLSQAFITGRDRSLAPFGITLDKVAVAAKAQEIALASGRQTVASYDKVAAAAALTNAKYADTLAKDVAEGAKSSELQLAKLRQEVKNTLAEMGKPLVAPFVEIATKATPVAIGLAKALSSLAESVLPAVSAALTAIVPLVELFAGAITLAAEAIAHIPSVVVAAAGAFLLLNNSMGLVFKTSRALDTGIAALTSPIGLAVIALTALNVATEKVASGAISSQGPIGELAKDIQKVFHLFKTEGGEDVNVVTQRINELRQSVFGAGDSIDDIRSGLEGLHGTITSGIIKSLDEARAKNDGFAASFDASGLSVQQFADASVGSDADFEKFLGTIDKGAISLDKTGQSLSSFETQLRNTHDTVQDAAREQLDLLESTDQITAANKRVAFALSTAKDGHIDYVKALRLGTKAAEEHAAALDAQAKAAADASPEFARLRDSILHGIDVSGELQAFADQFHLKIEDVKAALDPLQQAVQNFVSGSISAFPTASTAISGFFGEISAAESALASAMGGPADEAEKARKRLLAATDPKELLKRLGDQLKAQQDFKIHIKMLLDQGATEAVAAILKAGDAGPQLAAALVAGGPDVARSANLLFAGIGQEGESSIKFLTDVVGPALGIGAAEMAKLAGGQFGDNLDFTTPAATEVDAAKKALTDADVATAMGTVADDASAAYAEKFLIRGHTDAEIARAKASLDGDTTVPDASGGLGTRSSTSFEGKLAMDKAADAGLAAAATKFSTGSGPTETAAGTAGGAVGRSFSQGIVVGIGNNQIEVDKAAMRAVNKAKAAAMGPGGADAGSPSKLFMEVGHELAAGLAVGMDQNARAVEKAAQNLVHTTVGAFNNVALTAPTLQPAVAGAARVGGATGINNSTLNFDVSINVNGAMSQADAQAAAQTFASEAEIALMRRNVIARVRAV